MWNLEPVGFINFEPVECAYLSHLDMNKWASKMWKNEPVGFINFEPVECAYLSQLDMKEWASEMWKKWASRMSTMTKTFTLWIRNVREIYFYYFHIFKLFFFQIQKAPNRILCALLRLDRARLEVKGKAYLRGSLETNLFPQFFPLGSWEERD